VENRNQVGSNAPPKSIPIVIAAMNRTELQPLECPDATTVDSMEDVRDFLALLDASDIGSIRECYGDKRREWRPFGKDDDTIERLIEKIMDLHQKYSLKPDFSLSEDFFSLNQATRRLAWQKAGENGWCFLIIDGVSIHHPDIRGNVVHSLGAMKRNERVALAVLSPFDATKHEINEKLIELLEKDLQAVDSRYRFDLDPKVDILTGDTTCFHRWFRLNLEQVRLEIEEEDKRMNNGRRSWMQETQRPVRGYNDLV
jgi:hypothetical protein